MILRTRHNVLDLGIKIVNILTLFIGFQFYMLSFINDSFDWLNKRRSWGSNHFDQSWFFVCIKNLVDWNCSLCNVNTSFLLYFIFQIYNSFAYHSRKYASIIRWSRKFKLLISILYEEKHIQNTHFLDKIIKHPQNIIKAISSSILNTWN